MRRRIGRALAAGAPALALAALPAGCGFNVRSPDLFLLTRTGPAGKLSLLVNDGGTIRCDGGAAHKLPDATLIDARDIADSLAKLAGRLRLPRHAGTVEYFTVHLQQGTIAFPDAAAASHPSLAAAELFATQSADGVCAGRG